MRKQARKTDDEQALVRAFRLMDEADRRNLRLFAFYLAQRHTARSHKAQRVAKPDVPNNVIFLRGPER